MQTVIAVMKPHNDKLLTEHFAAETETLLEEIHGHLGAAVAQLAPDDDELIADHLRIAAALALTALRTIRKRPRG